ncbi:MAG: cytochrome c [Polyangiaceae bacterium]|nr:cytochrome c [Polyangiaceae bacterium]
MMRRFGWFLGLSFGALACGSPSDCPPCASGAASSDAPEGEVGTASATSAASANVASAPKKLAFKKLGADVRTLELDAILKAIPAETVKQYDPYYNREKTFRAVPLARVVELGFRGEQNLPTKEYVLRALDGYTVPLRGAKLFEEGGYIAFEDTEAPAWEPIGQQRANPGPFYIVWAKKEQTDLEGHPRPYQLATIEIADFESVFPFTVPTGEADGSPARKGFATFREECIHCHAINRQGGRVGPELNVPQSIVEYRPVDQIKAYIKDPLTFRYSTMPPHPKMSDQDLDDVVAYFKAMSTRKHDDERAKQPGAVPAPN